MVIFLGVFLFVSVSSEFDIALLIIFLWSILLSEFYLSVYNGLFH